MESPDAVVAVDAGTTGVKVVALDRAGAVLASTARVLHPTYPRPGWVEEDPDEIWGAVREGLGEVAGELADRGVQVRGLGIANQRETVVGFDRRDGTVVHPAIVWQDRRTAGVCEELSSEHLSEVRSRTGLVLDPYFSATKMGWLLDHLDGGPRGGARQEAARGHLALSTVDSWILWNLTGGPGKGVYATDPSNACRTLLYEIGARRWSPELCELFGVPQGALAEVRPSAGRLGRVDPGALPGGALGGVPVSALAGDQQAALFGHGCTQVGSAKVTYGTGTFVLVHAGGVPPPAPEGLLVTVAWDLGEAGGDKGGGGPRGPHGEGGPVAYALEGSAFSSGAALGWLEDMGLVDAPEASGALAGSVESAGGTVVVPAFAGLGSPWWDPRARGVVSGITRGTTRAHLVRAVVEAVACEVRAMVDAMAGATGRTPSVLHADGGLAALDLLMALQADLIGVAVARPASRETTARGAALLAGLAEGVWGTLEELTALSQETERFAPSAERGGAEALYGAWSAAVERARGWAQG